MNGDGIGRSHIASQMAQDPGLHHLRGTPLGLIQQNGKGDADIIPQIAGIHADQLFQGQAQLLFAELQIQNADQQLNAAGDQRAHGSALYTKLRKTAVAVNQQVIQADIDTQGRKRDHISDGNDPHRPQGRHQNIGHRKEDIGPADDLKIADALRDHKGVIG